MMLASVILAGWITVSAPWTPLTAFSLACTGAQTAYADDIGQAGVKQTLPWSETFTIDLVGGTYCSQGCATLHPLSAVTAAGLDLDNASIPDGSSLRRFTASSGAMQVNVVTAASSTRHVHLEETGTCALQPPASGL